MNASRKKNFSIPPPLEVIDLFCGIGGLSYGLKSQGFNIIAGYDIDFTCAYAYHHNNDAEFRFKDIKQVTTQEISTSYSKQAIRILAGCAPCQPFSSYAFKNKKKDPNKYSLLDQFGRLAKSVLPEIITMENVPQILNFKEKHVFQNFVKTLENCGYEVFFQVVYCPDYGIPQTRKRLVLLASKFGKIELIPPINTPDNYITVKNKIGT
ncbi:MAG: DNA (cytosine-5-)-methyltransferase, partial [Fibrobacteraceae bacterium]|nr:DNA (cytosine-5-)-methyltransferase [Fibrobacteraceae bacterium]